MLNARLLNLRLLTGFGSLLVKLIPAGLPAGHGLFRFPKAIREGFLPTAQLLQLRTYLGELLIPELAFFLVGTQMLFGFSEIALGLLYIVLQLAGALAGVLYGLFNAGNFRAHG